MTISYESHVILYIIIHTFLSVKSQISLTCDVIWYCMYMPQLSEINKLENVRCWNSWKNMSSYISRRCNYRYQITICGYGPNTWLHKPVSDTLFDNCCQETVKTQSSHRVLFYCHTGILNNRKCLVFVALNSLWLFVWEFLINGRVRWRYPHNYTENMLNSSC